MLLATPGHLPQFDGSASDQTGVSAGPRNDTRCLVTVDPEQRPLRPQKRAGNIHCSTGPLALGFLLTEPLSCLSWPPPLQSCHPFLPRAQWVDSALHRVTRVLGPQRGSNQDLPPWKNIPSTSHVPRVWVVVILLLHCWAILQVSVLNLQRTKKMGPRDDKQCTKVTQ